ncbi:hypothetical protein Q9L58_008232 [Maublancomyces gigas]|uniref:Uncharacterized protein n=1 Tax=Discina gigas TaxID=1032678 RepID=A0ABR3GAL0_9PEZI
MVKVQGDQFSRSVHFLSHPTKNPQLAVSNPSLVVESGNPSPALAPGHGFQIEKTYIVKHFLRVVLIVIFRIELVLMKHNSVSGPATRRMTLDNWLRPGCSGDIKNVHIGEEHSVFILAAKYDKFIILPVGGCVT